MVRFSLNVFLFFFVDSLGGCFIPEYFNSCFGSSFIDGISTCTYLYR
jgi:hypothetical protein